MANVEKDTNQVFRKKYFVDDTQIVRCPSRQPRRTQRDRTLILRAEKIRVNKPAKDTGDHDGFTVEPIRENGRLTRLRIRCQCGRSVELDCEYEQKK